MLFVSLSPENVEKLKKSMDKQQRIKSLYEMLGKELFDQPGPLRPDDRPPQMETEKADQESG